MSISSVNLGLRSYLDVLSLQERLFSYRLSELENGKCDKLGDVLLFCEHNPVFTIGKRDCSEDWLSDSETIAGAKIEVVKTNRGGKITYHGPGQLVCYFIFDINRLGLGVKDFVAAAEEVCLRTLSHYGINAVRSAEHPGLWVGNEKIVAVGFHISKGITMHGIAVNVAPDMSHFGHIVPCGIRDRGVTSMQQCLGSVPQMNDLIEVFGSKCSEVFGQSLTGSTEEKVKTLSSSSKTF